MDLYIHQDISTWKHSAPRIHIQPYDFDITDEFVREKVLPEMAKMYGDMDTKESKIAELKREIEKIELSILAMDRNVDIKIYKADECPF